MGQECGWRHARKRLSWEFEEFEKESVESWDWTMVAESWVSAIEARVGFGPLKMYLFFFSDLYRDLKHHKMRRALGMVSIVRIVPLSSCRRTEIKKLLYSHNQLYIHICICMQKHNDAMKTSRHSSLEKYTSHFIWKGSKGLLKVLLCERWVGDWTELQHIDPHSYGHNSVAFLGAQPFWDIVLIPASSLQLYLLIWGMRAPSSGCWFSLPHLISNWLEPPVYQVTLLFYAHSIQPVDSQGYPLDIFDRMHL